MTKQGSGKVSIRIGAVLALMVVGVACAFPGTTGSGTLISASRPVEGITEVQLAGIGTLIIAQGETEALTIEAEDNLLPRLTTDVRHGRLTIGTRDDWGWADGIRPTRPITYHLAVKRLTAIGLSGTGSVEARDLRTDTLGLDLSGTGSVALEGLTAEALSTTISGTGSFTGSGAVTRQRVHISGAGRYTAAHLQSRVATVVVSGTGGATVRVSEALEADVSGAGDVTYLGRPPAITRRVSGSGRVSPGQE